MGRILLASGEENLQRTRQLILEQAGYEVVSTLGLTATLQQCTSSTFDLFMIGHSIPDEHKQRLVQVFRHFSAAPIVCLTPTGDCRIRGINVHVQTTPEALVDAARDFIRQRN